MDAQLKLLMEEIGPFEDSFLKLHHFSKEEFSSKSSSFNEFVAYGKKVLAFSNGENKLPISLLI